MESNCAMLAAPDGRFFLFNLFNGKVYWSEKVSDNKIFYSAGHEDTVDTYMDATVNDFGELALCYCHTHDAPSFIPPSWPCLSYGEVSDYVSTCFGTAAIVTHDSSNLYLSPRGKRLDGPRENCFFQIKKNNYKIVGDKWDLCFSKYEVSFVQDPSTVMPMDVLYTHGIETFTRTSETLGVLNDDLISHYIWLLKEEMQPVKGATMMDATYDTVSCGNLGSSIKVVLKSFPMSWATPRWSRLLLNEQKIDCIPKFYGANTDESHYHLLFERYPWNLHSFFLEKLTSISANSTRLTKLEFSFFQKIMTSLIDGLMLLHAEGLCHTKLNPWNILVTSNYTIKFCGFSNFQPLTEQLVAKDLRDLAKLICYFHRVLDVFTEDDYENQQMESKSMFSWACEAKHIVEMFEIGSPLSLDQFLAHSFMWDDKRRVDFLMIAGERLNLPDDYTWDFIGQMNSYENRKCFKVSNWKSKIPAHVVQVMERKGGFYPDSRPRELLRFMRNIFVHHEQNMLTMRDNVGNAPVQLFGRDSYGAEYRFRCLFPSFLVDVYHFFGTNMSRTKMSTLRQFY